MPETLWQRARNFFAAPALATSTTTRPAPVLILVDDNGDPMTLAAAKAKIARPKAGGAEIGSSGIPRAGNILGVDEYNKDLQGKNAIKAYDKMRRSDGQTAAVLDIVKLPLLGAAWEVIPPEGGDSTDIEIAAHCHGVLIDDDGMADSWQFTLRHMLLMLDFGFSVLEKMWDIGPDGKLVYHRLAPRLPLSIERWEVDDATGALVTVVQRAVKNGQEQELKIPAEDVAVFVHQREGDNYNGRSMLRPLYKHFHYKDRLYAYDAIGHERLSVGIPKATTTTEADTSAPALDAIEQVLQGIRAHEKAFIIEMPGVTFSIMTTTHENASMMRSIEHHDVMIARGILAPFMNVGQSPNGTQSSTVALVDVFFNALDGVAEEIASDAKRQLIKPLCDVNWPMEGRKYPSLVARNIRKIDPAVLAETLSKIVKSTVLTVDDGIENAIRKILGYPPLDPKLSRATRAKATPAPGAKPGAPGAPDSSAQPDPKSPKGQASPSTAQLSAARQYGDRSVRDPNDFENRILSLSEIPRRLDAETERLVARLTEIRAMQIRAAAKALVAIDAQSPADRPFSALDPKTFTMPHGADIVAAIRSVQAAVMAFGAEEVRLELRRQGAPIALSLGDVDVALLLDATVSGGITSAASVRDALAASAKTLGEQLNAQLRLNVMAEAVRLRRAGLTGAELESALIEILTASAGKNVITGAVGKVNESFALGRTAEASKYRDTIAYVVQSSVLDATTCAPCGGTDGMTFSFGSQEQIAHQPPFVDCRGRENCRCVQLYVYAGGGG